MGPSPYSDIGRRARDLLTKDYNFGHKFTLSVPSSTGMGLTATGVKKDQIFVGDICTQYRSGNTTVDVKVDTYSNVSTKVTLDEALPGIKTALSFNVPDQKSGKPSRRPTLNMVLEGRININTQLWLRSRSLFSTGPRPRPRKDKHHLPKPKKDKHHLPKSRKSHVRLLTNQGRESCNYYTSWNLDVHYRNHHVAVNSSISLNPAPILDLNGSIGKKDISLGGEVAFDTTSSSFTKYNAGIMFNRPDFSTALILMDKGQTLKASYFHTVNPSTAVAAEMTHRFSNHKSRFTIGSSHIVDPITSLKTRFSNDGKVGMLYQREWRPKSLITFSGEYNTKPIDSSTKFGIALALKP